MKFVIMAGGQGTKLWPLSRDNYPKQFNHIIGSKSLFQLNVEALLQRYSPADIYVSVSENYVEYVRKQCPQIPRENYILEPHIKKATGPAACYSMLHMSIKHPDEVIMYYVQPVVLRTPVNKYLDMIEGIEHLVKEHHKFVTGGKYPLYPEVGSDYQSIGEPVENSTGLEVYSATDFIERPATLAEAEEMLEKMRLVLHCNHSAWTTEEFFEELKVYKKDWFDVSMELKELIISGASRDKILEIYSKFSTGNIELFTKQLYSAGKVQVVILPFNWRHITTWNDIYEYQKDTEGEDLVQGTGVFIDSDNNLVINKTNRVVAGIGLKDTIIVQSEDALLVCPRDDAGKVGGLLKLLEEQGLGKYL